MASDKELLNRLLGGRDPEELLAKDGLIDELKKALSERMLAAELDDHLETEAEVGAGNRRNGTSQKTMLTGTSKVTLDIRRDRSGSWSEADRPIPAPVPGRRYEDHLDVCAG